MDVLKEHSSYIYGIAIVATIIALAISTRYSLRNLFNIRSAGETLPSPSSKDEDSSRTGSISICPCDNTGNEGDDEADEEDVVSEKAKERQAISSHFSDPLNFFEHIQSEAKRVKRAVVEKTIEQSLTEQQLLDEKEAQCRQLAEIFRLMKEQQDQLGIGSMDDMQEQMKLYAI